MHATRWGLILLFVFAVLGCKGEVPVATNEDLEPDPEDTAQVLVFDDFTANLFGPPGDEPTWTATESGVIRTTGTPRGYFYTNQTFGDFTLSLEFRFIPQTESPTPEEMDKYNTGFLIYVPAEHENDKKWPRSLEVQGRYDQLGLVKSNARDVTINATDDPTARVKARKPVGEWNAIEITSKDGAVTSVLNGVAISECQPGELKEGHIGLQAEDFPVEFRNIRIRAE